jgi:hypothetical protein
MDEIMKGMQSVRVGLVILTPENLDKPWLHYEAGYLTQYILSGQGLVSPVLVNVKPSALNGPLANLNVTEFTKPKFEKLVKDINKKLTSPVDESTLMAVFDVFWGKLQAQVTESVARARRSVSLDKPFDQEKVLNQILTTVRQLAARSIDPDILVSMVTRRTSSGLKLGWLDGRRLLNIEGPCPRMIWPN